MIKLCVVDDDPKDLQTIKAHIARYQRQAGADFQVAAFKNGSEFLDHYKTGYDIVFLDIEMPGLDGMETARRLRKMDQRIGIVFVTNMAQFAIKGYEVKAVDFVVKPLVYYNFVDKLRRAIEFLEINRQKEIIIVSGDNAIRVPVNKIYFIEKEKNYIIYHSSLGEFRERGNMSDIEDAFLEYGFSKCIRGCLVNLRYVRKTSHNSVWVEDTVLPISRPQKKIFMNDLINYIGGSR